MPSSTSSSDPVVDPGQGPYAHHGPLAPGLRLTASDRPGVAQPVPERDVPPLPWMKMLLAALLLVIAMTAVWEWQMRRRGYEAGDLGAEASAWAEQRRRLEAGPVPVAIVGDSRILFGTDFDRFQKLTGVRPVQLALEGTNARPFLEDVADNSRFDGLLIVGITEASYYREEIGLGAKALERGKWEAPNQRISFILFRWLRRHLAMLDSDESLSTIVQHADPSWRKGAYGPYQDVWKLGRALDDRQYSLWTEIERNTYLRDHVIGNWMMIYGFPGPSPEIIAMTEARTRAAVARIRARGGEVVFVRPPSAPRLRALEDKAIPRARGWDRLLPAAQVKGIHADDMPALKGIAIPELSHVSLACSPLFTDAYVRAVAKLTPRLRLLPTAPPALAAGSCPPWHEH